MTGPGIDAVTLSDVRRASALAGLRVRSCVAYEGGVPRAGRSTFGPVVLDVGGRCLAAHFGRPPAPYVDGGRTAILIVSRYGDVQSTAAAAYRVDRGEPAGAQLYYEAEPVAVAGQLAAEWGLRGPVLCVSPAAEPVVQCLQVVSLLVGDGDADQALVILAEQAAVNGGRDHALAALIDGQP